MNETNAVADHWEHDIIELLDDLSSVQDELLDLLRQKQQAVATGDLPKLEELGALEEDLGQRLEACHTQRGELLQQAESDGLPGDSLSVLAQALPLSDQVAVGERIEETAGRMRLLRHEGLAGWVLAQRALLHVSQMLQIIAGGGEIQPTYGEGAPAAHRGGLVDEAA